MQPIIVSSNTTAVRRVLVPSTIRIDAPADVVCGSLLAYVERATELLVWTSLDARHIPGRWRATLLEGAHLVSCELIEGPLMGLILWIRVHDLGGASTLLQIEGTYMAPVKPLLERRRAQQLAEALCTGLAKCVQHAIAPGAGTRSEQRAAPRQVLALPIRLRVGDTPWVGVTRDVSATGLGLLVHATPQEAHAGAAYIVTHVAGAVEVLLGEGRLTARVRIIRAQPWMTGIDVGLCYGTPDESDRLRRRLAALDLWRGPPDEVAR